MRSLVNKLTHFQSFVYASDFDIFCLTETWLTECIYDHEILPNDFVLYRKDRPSRGGGVLIAIKASICSSQLPSPPDIEVISIKVGSVQEFVLSSVYIPPNASTSHVFSLVVYLTSLTSSFKRCIFVGDYNFPDIDWSTLTASSLSSSIFCEFIFDCNLIQHVRESTHVRGNILDLVLTTSHIEIEHITVHSHSYFNFSDHYAVSFSPLCGSSYSSEFRNFYVFDFSKANYNDLCSFLLELDFSVCFQSDNIEFIWFTIKSFIFEAMCLFIPKVRLKRRSQPKWFNSDIRHHLNCLRTMKRRFRLCPSVHYSNKIKMLETSLQNEITQARVTFESNLLESSQCYRSSAVFRYIRSFTKQNVRNILAK